MDSISVGLDIRLRAVMAEFGIRSNVELAQWCGADASAVSNWLAEKDQPHKSGAPVAHMTQLCVNTGLSLDWIYRGVATSIDPKLAMKLNKRIATGQYKQKVKRRSNRWSAAPTE